MVGEHLDLSSNPGEPDDAHQTVDRGTAAGRPFLGIRFNCCDVYARIYANEAFTAFRGHCPKCAKPVWVRIAYGGSDSRFFDVG
jgi:hypothetical protein